MTDIEHLGPDSIVYSFGVGTDTAWDEAMVDRFACKVYAYDPNPISQNFVQSRGLPPQFVFNPIGLATFDGTQKFYGREGKVSTSTVKKIGKMEELEVRTLKTLMRENGHSHIDVLKLDIEGSEFSVIPQFASLPINQILLEIHSYFYREGLKGLRRLWGKYLTKRLLWSLRRDGFVCVCVDTDNYTFIKAKPR
jgi:FkbM family methyltransferase